MGRLFDGLIAWSITNRLVVLLVALALLAAGVWTSAHASLDVLPDFTPARVVVQTEAPGMGTSDVETLVTTPLERALLGTPEVATVRSTSSPGLSVVTLTFDDATQNFPARHLVSERLQLAASSTPARLGSKS